MNRSLVEESRHLAVEVFGAVQQFRLQRGRVTHVRGLVEGGRKEALELCMESIRTDRATRSPIHKVTEPKFLQEQSQRTARRDFVYMKMGDNGTVINYSPII